MFFQNLDVNIAKKKELKYRMKNKKEQNHNLVLKKNIFFYKIIKRYWTHTIIIFNKITLKYHCIPFFSL